MFIHRSNLTEIKNEKLILERKISWLCVRINATMKIQLEKEINIHEDTETHLFDKIIVNKYHITRIFYKTLKRKYKKFLEDFKNDKRPKTYIFTLYKYRN